VVQRIPADASDAGAANDFAPDNAADDEGSESQSKKVSLQTIADQVYPMILRRLEVEKERSFGRLHSNR
jgi:hypothetical protein